MKKIFLLLLASSITYAASAQYQKYNIIYTPTSDNIPSANTIKGIPASNPALKQLLNEKLQQRPANVANKATTNGGINNGWISHYHAVDTLHGNYMDNHSHLVPIFFDSTLQQHYASGWGAINWSGVADIIDPSHFDYNRLME